MISLISYNLCKSSILLGQTTKEYNSLYIHLIEHNYKLITKTHAYASCLFLLESHEVDLHSYDILLSLIKDNNLIQKIISSSLERLLIVGQYPKNDIWRLYERSITIIRQSSSFNIDYLVLILTPLLLLRLLPLLFAHIGLSDRLMNKMVLEFAASTQ
ncbi:unnamed protein product [Rotaria sp. Silwood1]|nr:unnamed protein product [Rotaria sp. Silwood1]